MVGGWCWAERERSSGVSEWGHPSRRARSPNCHCTATNDSSASEKVQGPPGLAGTLLAADREGTLTSAGRSHPAPRRPDSECPAPGPRRGHSGTRHRPRAATRGSPGEGQGMLRPELMLSGALKTPSFVSYWKDECLGKGREPGRGEPPAPGAVPGRRPRRANISRWVTHPLLDPMLRVAERGPAVRGTGDPPTGYR